MKFSFPSNISLLSIAIIPSFVLFCDSDLFNDKRPVGACIIGTFEGACAERRRHPCQEGVPQSYQARVNGRTFCKDDTVGHLRAPVDIRIVGHYLKYLFRLLLSLLKLQRAGCF